jgi:hypothetical protein
MSTPMFCLALRPLHDTTLRQALLVDSQPMKPLEAANPATTLVTTTCSTICKKTRTAFQQPLGSSAVERAGVDEVQGSMNTAPQVVVVDTDTGDDVDDALALALTQTHHSDRSDTAPLEASEA